MPPVMAEQTDGMDQQDASQVNISAWEESGPESNNDDAGSGSMDDKE